MSTQSKTTPGFRASRGISTFRAALLGSAITLAMPGIALAQDAQSADDSAQPTETQANEPIVVRGEIARTIENSLAAKRNLSVIGDAIVGDDIGDLPDLSVAETLERVVGVTSDRFKGGASELSIRGLGAFLGSSFLNGREISSGSDGRDVNFGQFPSELINGAIVYKTQQASFIEGGVSGIIELQTLRPLDYGKSRLQAQALFGYSDYEDRVVGTHDLNYRFTASYVDQFQTGAGDIGIAIGGQIRRDTAPEEIFTSSSTYSVCNTIEGIDRSNDCRYLTDGNGQPSGASDQFYLVSNQYLYRAMATEADRDAVMGTIQWQPSPNLEFNFDGQYSYRDDIEERANLVIADGRRDIVPFEVSETGALLAWSGESRIENQTVWRQRTEEYIGLGGNMEWNGGPLTLALDVSYSQTKRRQDEKDMRVRTNRRVFYEIDRRVSDIPELTFTDVTPVEGNTGLTFDLDNHDIFDNGDRARRRLENVDDDIFAVRLDGTYELNSVLKTVQVGFRYADRRRVHDDGIDTTVTLVNGYDSPAAIRARQPFFIVDNLFQGADTPMEGLTFATWDAQALFAALTGSADAGLPVGSTLSPQDADVSETTYAGYVQGNFDTSIGGAPATGNVGLRVVRSEISSVGISTALATSVDPGDPTNIIVTPVGTPTVSVEDNSFTDILPSVNLAIELQPDLLLRLAGYRAIARPDQEAMSAALDFDDEADAASISNIVSASGNPFLEPLKSWNADVSLEWYASRTSSVAVAAYYKNLQTGFTSQVDDISVIVDGVATPLQVTRTVNSNDKSYLFGFEISAQHQFESLPAPLDGFGIQASYNYADSNFEFPSPGIGRNGNRIADFVQPANIPGYSKHTANATLFYEKGPFSTRIAYKYRSSYFKPFRNDQNRYTEGQGFLDFSSSLNVTDNVQVRFQVLNILNEPNIFYRPTPDSLAQADYSGRRYFLGLRGRF